MAYQFWCHRGEPQRTRFVGFEHGYHGDTFGAMAVSRDPVFFGRFEPLLFQADIVPLRSERLDEHLRAARGEVAAVIVEPLVQGAGGMRMHSPETLRRLFEVAQRHGVLFIADEVMTGGGRTGTLWAHQAAGIAPGPDLRREDAGRRRPAAGGDAGRPEHRRRVRHRRPQPHVLPRPFVHRASAGLRRRRGELEAADRAAADPAERTRSVLDIAAVWIARRIPVVKDVRIRGSIAAVEIDVPGGYLADVGRRMRDSLPRAWRAAAAAGLGALRVAAVLHVAGFAGTHRRRDEGRRRNACSLGPPQLARFFTRNLRAHGA